MEIVNILLKFKILYLIMKRLHKYAVELKKTSLTPVTYCIITTLTLRIVSIQFCNVYCSQQTFYHQWDRANEGRMLEPISNDLVEIDHFYWVSHDDYHGT